MGYGKTLSALIAACAATLSCSSFSGGDDVPAAGDAGVANAEGGPVTGTPDKTSFSVEPIGAVITIEQGSSAKVHVSVGRDGSSSLSISVSIVGLPNGLSAQAVQLMGTSEGDLEIIATGDAVQGSFDAIVTLDNQGFTVTTPLKLFVRGAPGAIDTTWALQGHRQSLFGRPATVQDLVLAPDDSVFVVAECQPPTGNTQVCIAHLNPQGDLDATYGDSGVAIVDHQKVHAAALQSSGKLIVVGGDASPTGATTTVYPTFVARLTTQGALDTATFAKGNGAIIWTSELPGGLAGKTNGARALAVLTDDDLMVAWDLDDGAPEAGSMRLSADGDMLRFSYANAGATFTPNGVAMGVALRTGGAAEGDFVTVTGYAGLCSLSNTKTVDGTIDSALGTSAPKYIDGFGRADNSTPGIVELSDGTSVVASQSDTGLVLLKLAPDGSPAAAFGAAGVAGPFTINATPSGIVAQSDGKIIVTLLDGRIARFAADGSQDNTFGQAGVVTTPLSNAAAHRRPAIQKSGRILVTTQTQGAALDASVSAYWF